MNPVDIFILARTKLKSHRIRTGVTVVIAGLLFGLIIMVIMVVQGVFSSVDRYGALGLNDRAIVAVTSDGGYAVYNPYDRLSDPDFVRDVEAAYLADIAHKRSVAKKYSVDYDPAMTDPSPVSIDSATKEKTVGIDAVSSAVVQEVVSKWQAKSVKPFSINDYIKPYNSATLRGEFTGLHPSNGEIHYMKDSPSEEKESSGAIMGQTQGVDDGLSLTLLNESISRPFVTSTSFDPAKGEIPVILPVGTAGKLLGLPKLAKDASMEDRRERLRYIRAHIGEVTALFCYRNSASQALLQDAVAQHKELKRFANTKDYQKPLLLYEAPDEKGCGATTIKSDTRSASEKKVETNRILFEKEVGVWSGDPVQHKVTVRGVGVSGDVDASLSATVSIAGMVGGLLNNTLGYNTWSIPRDLFERLPESSRPKEVFAPKASAEDRQSVLRQPTTYLVEFTDKQDARKLLEAANSYNGSPSGVYAIPFGSGTLFIDELRTWLERILGWALVIVGSIAAVILWGIVGRTIADSRRESAVFRAIGATRLDIASIYGTYVILLALRVVLFAVLLGTVVALTLDVLFSDGATLGAQLAYAAVDTDIRFHLIGFASWYLLFVVGFIILIALIASIIPIILGARRSPINDMRNEG